MMSLLLYNSLKRTKEPFIPVTPGRVGIYFCGPTVYSEPHLGHARGPILFDVIRRWFIHQGYQVRLVSNVTDVGHLTDDMDNGEDKLEKRAKLEQLEPMEVAEKYFWAYFDAMAKLNVRRPSIVPRASGHITEQLALIQTLLARGFAYEQGGSVYFDVSAWENYGELSGRNPDELLEGTRISVRSDKDDPRDFALWKRAEAGHIMRWQSPWGEGYPGWHLECSVMSTKYLGDEFDIHGGGLDLLFPHHECELAQARAAGKPFARYWLHWNMLTLSGEKMAKSKGHVVTLDELFKQHDPLAVRFHLLMTHYRSVSDFSDESLAASAHGLRRLHETYRELLRRSSADGPGDTEVFADYHKRFATAMNDDFNTAQAIAVLFEAARESNSLLAKNPATPTLLAAKSLFESYAGEILGVLPEAQQPHADLSIVDGLVQLILEQRQEARLRRDFKQADAIRAQLQAIGIAIEDTPEGPRWKFA
ncbi:MAG: cysteine--tRNA ligase [Truepera sp.]|nr:cysteine--tRNA ligase [Truepera sp.]